MTKKANHSVREYMRREYHRFLLSLLEHPLSPPFQGQDRTFPSTANSQNKVPLDG